MNRGATSAGTGAIDGHGGRARAEARRVRAVRNLAVRAGHDRVGDVGRDRSPVGGHGCCDVWVQRVEQRKVREPNRWGHRHSDLGDDTVLRVRRQLGRTRYLLGEQAVDDLDLVRGGVERFDGVFASVVLAPRPQVATWCDHLVHLSRRRVVVGWAHHGTGLVDEEPVAGKHRSGRLSVDVGRQRAPNRVREDRDALVDQLRLRGVTTHALTSDELLILLRRERVVRAQSDPHGDLICACDPDRRVELGCVGELTVGEREVLLRAGKRLGETCVRHRSLGARRWANKVDPHECDQCDDRPCHRRDRRRTIGRSGLNAASSGGRATCTLSRAGVAAHLASTSIARKRGQTRSRHCADSTSAATVATSTSAASSLTA